jgi:hypothetical protein
MSEEEYTVITAFGWSNKKETINTKCNCGTWKQHWLNYSGQSWPQICSVQGCLEYPTHGAHIINQYVTGTKIVPVCSSCNSLNTAFDLDGDVILVSANASNTCG